MFSKRIVISILVIGCLVHFITCPSTTEDKKQNTKSPSKSPAKATLQNPRKIAPQPAINPAVARPRGLPPNNKEGTIGKDNSKSPAAGKPMKPVFKKPAADETKNKISENTGDNQGGGEEAAEEKPAGRLRRAFKRINNFRKKFCPFRFFGRFAKKIVGSNKSKPTDNEEPES